MARLRANAALNAERLYAWHGHEMLERSVWQQFIGFELASAWLKKLPSQR